MTDPWADKGFGWSNMFLAPDGDPRPQGPVAGERDVLTGYRAFQRGTLEVKCAGLTPEQLCSRPIPSTDLTLLGLVRHMATVEYGWFQIALQDVVGDRPFRPTKTPSEEFDLPEPSDDLVREAFTSWHEQCGLSDEFIAAHDLETRAAREPGKELREVLVHMIEEYARHNGHADLLREAIDGRRGQ